MSFFPRLLYTISVQQARKIFSARKYKYSNSCIFLPAVPYLILFSPILCFSSPAVYPPPPTPCSALFHFVPPCCAEFYGIFSLLCNLLYIIFPIDVFFPPAVSAAQCEILQLSKTWQINKILQTGKILQTSCLQTSCLQTSCLQTSCL